MRTTLKISALALAATLAGGVAASRANDDNKLIVNVHGKATALEIELTVVGTGEEAQDAERKYRDKLARVLAAVRGEHAAAEEKPGKKPKAKKDEEEDEDGPKKPGKAKAPKGDDEGKDKKGEKGDAPPIPVAVTERGFKYSAGAPKAAANPMMVFGGGEPPKPEAGSRFESKVVVTVKDPASLDRATLRKQLATLIDAATEAGAEPTTGSAGVPAVRFLAEDVDALRKLAYEDALTHAKTRMGDMATAAGLSKAAFGVKTVREIVPAAASASGNANPMGALFGMLAQAATGDDKAPSFEVTDEVDLEVTFGLPSK